MSGSSQDATSVVIIGGCGHVGLPLGVKFALSGADTTLIDIDQRAVDNVNSGTFPFLENGGDEQLTEAIEKGLVATVNPEKVRTADAVVFVTGTPVDEHLNPKVSEVVKIFDHYVDYFTPGTLIVMRSTLFPGTMEHLHSRLQQNEVDVKIAFCPERVAQGFGLDEIESLPQIVSAFDEDSFDAACKLFARMAPEILRLTPLEAEMSKLMANSWRYLEFAIANQFYMIAETNGVDFSRIQQAIRYKYPRANGYKTPGFAAGPCLFKDTMQLASFYDHQFYMGHSAMLVNEGLATFAANKCCESMNGSLWGKNVGLLGMSFKADNDDIRESLSFKVKKTLEFLGANVLCHDPYQADSPTLEDVLEEADAFVLGVPHREYKQLDFGDKPMTDVWGVYNQSELEIIPGRSNND